MEFSRKYLSIFARSSVLYVRLGFQDVSDSRDYGTFKGPLSGLRQFLASPLKMIKNVSKPYLFSRYLNFCPDFFYVKNSFMRKLRVISKVATSQIGKQITTLYILTNIFRSGDNHTMKQTWLVYRIKLEKYFS